MQVAPITEEQESSLRLWVSKVGRRPGKRAKNFLQAREGLSKQQIDQWFESYVNDYEPKDHTRDQDPLPENFYMPSQDFSQDTEMITADAPSEGCHHELSIDGVTFDSYGLDFMSSNASELQGWSPIGLQDHVPDSEHSMLEPPGKSSLWSPTMASQGCFSKATLSSISESSPLLSPPSLQQDYLSLSDKSSYYESSLRTWDTASTLVSTYDHSLDDLKDCEYDLEDEPSISSASLIRIIPPPVSRFSRQASVKDDNHRRVHSHSSCHISSESNLTPQENLSELPRNEVVYKCTACDSCFARKGDWKRHEEGHDPPTLWTCMLGETLFHSRSQWNCVFCDSFKRNRDEMIQHLMEEHRVFKCANKKPMFPRKDKLKQHLQQVHALSESSIMWESWHQPARMKWAWGCGYCGACLFTWEGRMIHLAEHYEKQPTEISRWSRSLVVKGLLKQAKSNFNVIQAWKNLAGDEPSGAVEWSKESAIALKHRLEYHDGTPQQLAKEAFKLARFLGKKSSSSHVWTSQASTTAIHVPSMNSNNDSGSRALFFEAASHTGAPTDAVAMKDVEMISADTNFF